MSPGLRAYNLEEAIQSFTARLERGMSWEAVIRSLEAEYEPSQIFQVTDELLFRLASRRLDAGEDWERVSQWVHAHELSANTTRLIRRLNEPAPGRHLADGWLFLTAVRRGPYADVWKVEKSSRTGRSHAAIKLLRLDHKPLPTEGISACSWDEREARRRFGCEAEIHACLGDHSPFLCRHFASGTWRDIPYIMMEWIDGEYLDVYCRQARLTPRQRVQLFIKILMGVEALHFRSIAHRDLKPCNILISTDADGEPFPKLVDFGGATTFSTSLTAPLAREGPSTGNQSSGAGRYRTPEQSNGNPASQWSTECDVYRLGVVLHEVLYGFRPWQWLEPFGESVSHELGRAMGSSIHTDWSTRNNHLSQQPPAPSSHRDHENGLSEADCEGLAQARGIRLQQYVLLLTRSDVWEVVRSALRVDPSERPSLGALRAQLEALVAKGSFDLTLEDCGTRLDTTPDISLRSQPLSAQTHLSTRVAVLIATRDRPHILRERALPSVAAQTLAPHIVVLVNDGVAWTRDDVEDLRGRLRGSEVLCLHNERVAGVGGAWNTGLARLCERRHGGFVAILDDDDLWDADHLQLNHEAATVHLANIVVAGLRLRSAAGDLPRPFVARLSDRDFMTGNPGWQGSNTFVHIDLLAAVGGFRESLQSLHDRDLAIRLLRHRDARSCLVPKWTSTWCMDLPGRLSDRRGMAKLNGLRAFWTLYSAEMTSSEQRAFFDRAEVLFGFLPDEIVMQHPQTETRTLPHSGDLHV
jgi:serine/threonine protein kinase